MELFKNLYKTIEKLLKRTIKSSLFSFKTSCKSLYKFLDLLLERTRTTKEYIMYKIIILAMILNISSFANIINSNYISKTLNISCNISFDPSNNNFKYSCKNIKISEILLKDLNGFTIARKTVDRPFDGYGTFNNINGRPSKISCYVIYQNKIVEISNLKNIEYSSSNKPSGQGKVDINSGLTSKERLAKLRKMQSESSSNKPAGTTKTTRKIVSANEFFR